MFPTQHRRCKFLIIIISRDLAIDIFKSTILEFDVPLNF